MPDIQLDIEDMAKIVYVINKINEPFLYRYGKTPSFILNISADSKVITKVVVSRYALRRNKNGELSEIACFDFSSINELMERANEYVKSLDG